MRELEIRPTLKASSVRADKTTATSREENTKTSTLKINLYNEINKLAFVSKDKHGYFAELNEYTSNEYIG